MLGDSLSVSEFGEAMQCYLTDRFERKNVALYASCGSSPEHWLRNGPLYVTRCGYRELSPTREIVRDFEHGRPPSGVPTPRLEDLLPSLRPTIVIVQLGTNWMDAIAARKSRNDPRYCKILNDFVSVLRCPPSSVSQIIWVTPPDASRFSGEVKQTVETLIEDAARKDDFQIIDSRKMTRYVRGKSGGDGVHYSSKEAKEWASKVTQELDRLVQK